MVTTGILPLQGKIPMVEPGIEPGISWLVVRSSDHQTTRLVEPVLSSEMTRPGSTSCLYGFHKFFSFLRLL